MNLDQEKQAIRNELEAMREGGARRQELSLHACKRLFFDLGIRPSMTAVRDLTQSGSASDIPKDIEHFWERIRNASRVRIGAGAIPKALEERAGELLGALFEEAVTQARVTLDDERNDLRDQMTVADSRVREAEIRREAAEEAIQRSEQRAQSAWERIRELETALSSATTQGNSEQQGLHADVLRLERENDALRQRLDTELASQSSLRDRIDTLHVELRERTEHYAQQIKDAVGEAERRVKPMLVELDSLRSMAATYQTGVRDASRKEFEFIQQIAAAKARGDRLDAQLREQSDELDASSKEVAKLRAQQGIDPSVAQLLCSLAGSGRLSPDELRAIGTAVDGHVPLPPHCPKCEEGEPELAQVDHRFELQCPECDYSSGLVDSRLEALSRFGANPVTASP